MGIFSQLAVVTLRGIATDRSPAASCPSAADHFSLSGRIRLAMVERELGTPARHPAGLLKVNTATRASNRGRFDSPIDRFIRCFRMQITAASISPTMRAPT